MGVLDVRLHHASCCHLRSYSCTGSSQAAVGRPAMALGPDDGVLLADPDGRALEIDEAPLVLKESLCCFLAVGWQNPIRIWRGYLTLCVIGRGSRAGVSFSHGGTGGPL